MMTVRALRPTSAGIAELREIIDREALHRKHCATLRERYGKPAPGCAVIELRDYVEADEKRVVADIKAAADRTAREINLLIDSPGGLTAAMWRIIAALDAFKGHKRAVVVGRCASAATGVLAACDDRLAPATAEFLIHAPGFYEGCTRYPYTPPRHTAVSLDREAARLADRGNKLAALYVRRTGSTALADMIASGADCRLSAAEARAHDLITKIEPAESAVLPGSKLAAYYSPKRAQAYRAVAAMARRNGRASGPAHLSIDLRGEIGERKPISVHAVRRQLATARDASSFTVWLDSIGGSLDESFKIFALLAEHGAIRKKAIVKGACHSAAVVVLMACDLRIAWPRAEIMIHQAEINPWMNRDDRWTAAHHRLAAVAVENADAAIADLLALRTGYDRESFVREMRHERPMRLVDALKCGLIHEAEGVPGSRPCDPSWPAKVQSAVNRGVVFGLPSHLLSDNYLAACLVAPGGGGVQTTNLRQ